MPQKIAVVGLGYVGLPLALLAARKGYSVIGIDINPQKVRLVKNGIAPFFDKKIAEELAVAKLSDASTDFRKIRSASIIVICVPTPVHEDHKPDLRPLTSATTSIGKNLKLGQLVILESTVNPGASEKLVLPTLQKTSGLVAGKDFFLAHCPERINPGDSQWNVENIPRVVGSYDQTGLEQAMAFYTSILKAPVKAMGSLKEAEAVKIVENSFRDINIAFVNELAMSFERLGINIMNVIEGAASKPFSFMAHYPGCGVGGHCIPVDPYYLIAYAKENGFNHDFLTLARRINSQMPAFTVKQMVAGFREKKISLNKARIGVLGLAYKADIDDCRESPSFEIIRGLEKLGAQVISYDPFVPKQSTARTLDAAVHGSQGVVVTINHGLFKTLTPGYFAGHGVSVIVDGRNCLAREKFAEAGIIYKGIGIG